MTDEKIIEEVHKILLKHSEITKVGLSDNDVGKIVFGDNDIVKYVVMTENALLKTAKAFY